jgi:hypothetical protein
MLCSVWCLCKFLFLTQSFVFNILSSVNIWVPTGLAPFRGLMPLGRRNLVPIPPPAHPLGGGRIHLKISITNKLT